MTLFTRAATLCAATYKPDPNIVWDAQGLTDAVWWGIKDDWIAMRGSVRLPAPDWLRDFLAVPVHPRTQHPQLGWVHAGFLMGMEDTWAQIKGHLAHDAVKVTGHSLGAAHATILCGLWLLDFPGSQITRVVFGEPAEAIGEDGLNALLDQSNVTNYSFANAAGDIVDPITTVPPHPYNSPTDRIHVQVPGMAAEFTDAPELHHMAHYQQTAAAYGDVR